MEKKIESWEKEKAYPTLDEMYQMAYIININPGELLAIRNRGRKQFNKESAALPSEKRKPIELGENTALVLEGLGKLFGFFALVIFCIVLYKFVDTFFGKTGGIVVDQVITRDIQEHTGQENEMINDGSVANMVRRVREEAAGTNHNATNTISNEVDIDNKINTKETEK